MFVPPFFGSMIHFHVKTTSSAVNGFPSDQTTPSFSFHVTLVPSAASSPFWTEGISFASTGTSGVICTVGQRGERLLDEAGGILILRARCDLRVEDRRRLPPEEAERPARAALGIGRQGEVRHGGGGRGSGRPARRRRRRCGRAARGGNVTRRASSPQRPRLSVRLLRHSSVAVVAALPVVAWAFGVAVAALPPQAASSRGTAIKSAASNPRGRDTGERNVVRMLSSDPNYRRRTVGRARVSRSPCR